MKKLILYIFALFSFFIFINDSLAVWYSWSTVYSLPNIMTWSSNIFLFESIPSLPKNPTTYYYSWTSWFATSTVWMRITSTWYTYSWQIMSLMYNSNGWYIPISNISILHYSDNPDALTFNFYWYTYTGGSYNPLGKPIRLSTTVDNVFPTSTCPWITTDCILLLQITSYFSSAWTHLWYIDFFLYNDSNWRLDIYRHYWDTYVENWTWYWPVYADPTSNSWTSSSVVSSYLNNVPIIPFHYYPSSSVYKSSLYFDYVTDFILWYTTTWSILNYYLPNFLWSTGISYNTWSINDLPSREDIYEECTSFIDYWCYFSNFSQYLLSLFIPDIEINWNWVTDDCVYFSWSSVDSVSLWWEINNSISILQRFANVISVFNPIAPSDWSDICTFDWQVHTINYLQKNLTIFDIVVIILTIFPIFFLSHITSKKWE